MLDLDRCQQYCQHTYLVTRDSYAPEEEEGYRKDVAYKYLSRIFGLTRGYHTILKSVNEPAIDISKAAYYARDAVFHTVVFRKDNATKSEKIQKLEQTIIDLNAQLGQTATDSRLQDMQTLEEKNRNQEVQLADAKEDMTLLEAKATS